MNVQLYVYDLSRGLARQMSAAFLGTQIDAVYHTSLVFNGIEYFFGAGIQTSYPGSTHHGQPMEIISMGRTELETEVILEYLESLKLIYTHESYDLFLHNCNNFTNDFATFLVGKGIPNHITSLPQTVLNTPFGQMLKPQLDNAMRGVTQAPVPPSAVPPSAQKTMPTSTAANRNFATRGNGKQVSSLQKGMVRNVTQSSELNKILESANDSCAVIFFTSSMCAPCKICYPTYDSLAEEFPTKVALIKVDISFSAEISSNYKVRATPTFMTFLKGSKVEEWSGADPAKLLGNVRLLVQMAYPSHPHNSLKLPTLQRHYEKPVTYAKVPPLEKLVTKLGTRGYDPSVTSLTSFIKTRNTALVASATVPDLSSVSVFIRSSLDSVEPADLFPLIDLLRLALVDARVSGFFAEESRPLILHLLNFVKSLSSSCPYSLRLVTIQAACNLFTSPLFPSKLLSDNNFCSPLIALIVTSLLDENATARVAAASLAFNVVAFNHHRRLEQEDDLISESAQVELAASLLESVDRETKEENLKGLILTLGLLAYSCPEGGELRDILSVMGAKDTIQGKRTEGKRDLVEEVTQVVGV